MPQSWPEKKKALFDGQPHQQKPDVDNYLKGIMDALCDEDEHVYDAHPYKFWAREGSIVLKEHEGEITWPKLLQNNLNPPS
jgi:Holliday junction resolvase RusA-like endonuclease